MRRWLASARRCSELRAAHGRPRPLTPNPQGEKVPGIRVAGDFYCFCSLCFSRGGQIRRLPLQRAPAHALIHAKTAVFGSGLSDGMETLGDAEVTRGVG